MTESVLNLYVLDTYDTSFLCCSIQDYLFWTGTSEGEIGCVTKWSRVKTQVMIPSGMAIMRTVTGPRGKVAKVAKILGHDAFQMCPDCFLLPKLPLHPAQLGIR